MKILHVWSTAGVPSIISRYQRSLGHDSKVVYRKSYDQYKLNSAEDIGVKGGSKRFVFRMLWQIIKMRPDIIHIHSWLNGVTMIRKFTNRFKINSKIVYHAHGSDIRDYGIANNRIFEQNNYPVDYYIVSTKDLLEFFDSAEHIINPIIKKGIFAKIPNTALFCRTYPEDRFTQAANFAIKHELKLEVIDRIANQGVPFDEFQDKLNKVEYYLDIKWGTNKDQLSKAGYEALASGCTVVDDEENIHDPSNYDTEEISKQSNIRILQIYDLIFAS